MFCFAKLTCAQNVNKKMSSSFDAFLKLPEDAVYLHVNKSVLLEGEDLAFSAYVINERDQKPSKDVKNLYCQLLDAQGIQ